MNIEIPAKELARARAALPAGGKKLTGVAVYVAICELAAEGKDASKEAIAERAGGSPATVWNYLEPLAEAGVILVDEQARGPWLYRIPPRRRPRRAKAQEDGAAARENAVLRKLLSDMGVTAAQISARLAA